MKAERMIMIILVTFILIVVPGCTKSGGLEQKKEEQSTEKSSVKERESAKYVTYKREHIIRNVEKLNMEIGFENLMLSRAIMVSDIEKYLPIDNIRKIPGGFLIEYPMEDSEFEIITDGDGIVFGSFLRRDRLHAGIDMKGIKNGMTLDEVKKVFPEISVDASAEKVLSDSKHKKDEVICEVILENYQYGKITFKNKNGKIVVIKTETMDMPFSDAVIKEALMQNSEALENKYTVITNNGKIVFGKKIWDQFYMRTEKGLANLIGQIQEKEMLEIQNASITIKNYYGDTDLISGKTQDEKEGFAENVIVYDGKQYFVNRGVMNEKSTYKYLIERKGRMKNAAVGDHVFYLVNDKSLTYEQLQWSVFSSQSSDWIDYYTVFREDCYDS